MPDPRPEDVLLVPAYRVPGAMNTWWYAAIGSDDDDGHCTMGQAKIPPPNDFKAWNPRFVWTLHRHQGYVQFINKQTRANLLWAGANLPLGGGNAGTDEKLWSLDTGVIDKWPNPGFAIRPYHDTRQNLNALDGWQGGHDGMVGAKVGAWGWCGGQENETWSIMRLDPQNMATGLDANGGPVFGARR